MLSMQGRAGFPSFAGGGRFSLPLGEGGPKGRMRVDLTMCFTLLIERLPLFAWGATTPARQTTSMAIAVL